MEVDLGTNERVPATQKAGQPFKIPNQVGCFRLFLFNNVTIVELTYWMRHRFAKLHPPPWEFEVDAFLKSSLSIFLPVAVFKIFTALGFA